MFFRLENLPAMAMDIRFDSAAASGATGSCVLFCVGCGIVVGGCRRAAVVRGSGQQRLGFSVNLYGYCSDIFGVSDGGEMNK